MLQVYPVGLSGMETVLPRKGGGEYLRGNGLLYNCRGDQ